MDLITLAVIATGLILYSLVSGRLHGTLVTAPMVFAIYGLLVGAAGLNVVQVDVGHSAIHLIAEFTLILVLFADASRFDLDRIRRDHNLPVRMLVIGLPLAIVAGAFAATLLFPMVSLWEAALLAALLAPTDAALGQTVVNVKEVPVRIRQSINIESGLNDGIALPAVLLFAALAGSQQDAMQSSDWLRFGLLQITLGPLIGIFVGYVGARLIDLATGRGWVNIPFQGIAILSLAAISYVSAELIGGNGFISAFIGGMVFGNTLRHPCNFLFQFIETEGQLLMLITFMIFGAALLPEALANLSAAHFMYACLSLTIIRIIPIAISLIGTGLTLPTKLFLGWFGPRGLASILFVLLILEESEIPHREEIFSITILTVALSILLHGLSAAPFAKLYGRYAASKGECEESRPTTEMPLREGTKPRSPR